MATHIKLSSERIPQYVEVTQVGFDVDMPADYDGEQDMPAAVAWQQIDGITHQAGGEVACAAEDADAVEARLTEAGFAPTRRRPVYAVSGPHGDVIHRIYEDE